MSIVRLQVIESPLDATLFAEGQWIDVALSATPAPLGKPPFCWPDAGTRLIPFSIFTHRFFRDELPGLISCVDGALPFPRNRSDSFYLHPENNQAIALRERFPQLRQCRLGFQYYIDPSGLAEIVLEAPTISRSQLVFAARLFCLQNSIQKATLDGTRIPGVSVPFR
jgi:hypothetical protein